MHFLEWSAKLHSMLTSANSRAGRRRLTSHRISLCAQTLTEEHGLDGFTMEELAQAAGVSRRTLFNYYAGKIDAVLGAPPRLCDEDIAQFHARGQGSDLFSDLRLLGERLLDARSLDRDELARTGRILTANPRLLAAAHERFQVLSGEIVEEIRDREGGDFDAQRTRIAIRLLGALFDAALDTFLTDPRERPLADAFDDVLHEARLLLA